MTGEELVSFLDRCASAFEWWNDSRESDAALARFFDSQAGNTDVVTVREKVRRLDKEYSTRITTRITWDGMARHITQIRFKEPPLTFDERLGRGDFRCVDAVELVAASETRNGKPARLRSFAAKYCHFSNSESFPIYDSYADSAVTLLNGHLHFSKRWTQGYSEMEYAIWMGDVYSLRDAVVPNWTLKRLDQALWCLGAINPDTELDQASKDCLVHRVAPVPAALFEIKEDDSGWPCAASRERTG